MPQSRLLSSCMGSILECMLSNCNWLSYNNPGLLQCIFKYSHNIIICYYSQEQSETCPDEPEKDWYVCKSLKCEHESKCIVAAKDYSSSNLSSTQSIFISTPQPHLIQQQTFNCATALTFEL